jgi:hypothetical protein
MGAKPSSSVAERHLQMQIDNLMEVFGKEEQPFLQQDATEHPAIAEFLQGRRQLSISTGRNQEVLWAARGYTDDFELTLVWSPGRAYRIKRAMYWTIGPGGSNLLLAPKTVWSTQLDMIGACWLLNFHSCYIPESKRLTLLRQTNECLSGTQEVQEYRSMVGLLWWVVGALMLPLKLMNGTSAPLQGDGEITEGPNTWVRHRAGLWQQMQRWQQFMTTVNGRPVAAALSSEVPHIEGGMPVVYWSSDACTKDSDTLQEGVAGVDNGLFWQYLPPPHLSNVLHITSIEALGRVGNTMHFGPLYPTGTQVVSESDAAATVSMDTSEVSKSQSMIHIQQAHSELADYQRMRPTTITTHIHGVVNDFADWVSRNKMEQFYKACGQMGIKPRRIKTKPEFEDLYAQIVNLNAST